MIMSSFVVGEELLKLYPETSGELFRTMAVADSEEPSCFPSLAVAVQVRSADKAAPIAKGPLNKASVSSKGSSLRRQL